MDALGAPGGGGFSSQEVRWGFYYCSWSFVRWLLARGGMAAFLKVYDAGGEDAAYEAAYGRPLADLRSDWLKTLK